MIMIEILYNSLFKKQNLLIVIFLILIIIFHQPIELLFTNTIVKYAFSYVKSTWYNDLIFVLILVYTLILIIHSYKKYIPSKNLIYALITITFIYIIYRIYNDIWVFTPFLFDTKLKYADTLIIVSICSLLLFVKRKSIDRKNGKDSFFADEAIGKERVDELGYTTYTELLASKIKNSYFDKSFAIGINGKWGSGKTSFIDLLKRKIDEEKEDEIIEVNFNPWNSNSSKAIIQDFFETIQESIKPYHYSLSNLLISYSNKLVALNDNTTTKSIQTSVTVLTGFESLNSIFENINKALKKINKKIVVYIDDLDRLDKDEIIEVIRLIRNTANFYRTFFVVAYDRNYIVNALKNHNTYKQEQFLEKIFQIEITLPYFKKDILKYKLAQKLLEKNDEDFNETINSEILQSTEASEYLNIWLDNIRDVTRLANALILNLTKLKGEVVFKDFLRVELLRLKYPAIYELLFNKTIEFLEPVDDHSKKFPYKLKNIDDDKKRALKDTPNKSVNKELELFLYENYNEIFVPKNDIQKIITFIDSIFGGDTIYNSFSRSHLSIVYPSKFNRYFTYNLLEDSLSEVEFSKARDLSQEEFNLKIIEWVQGKLEIELKNRFSEIKSFDNKEDFEKVIKAIFHLANQKSLFAKFYHRELVGYDGKDLYYNKLYKDNLIRYYGEIYELNSFILSLFENAKSPFSFEADFINYINNEFSDSFPLTKDELGSIVINYFKTYCIDNKKLDANIWSLFHDCKQADWISSGGNSYKKEEIIPEEAKSIMKDFVLNKDLDGFLLAIINVEIFKKDKFAISDIILNLFDSWQLFKKSLDQQNEEKWSYLKEFKIFYLTFEEGGFSQYVDFKFDVVPIEQKIQNRHDNH